VASNYTLKPAINPHTGRPYTKSEWLAAEAIMLRVIKEVVSAGGIVTLNGLSNGGRYWAEPEVDRPRALLPYVQGAMSESIWRTPTATTA